MMVVKRLVVCFVALALLMIGSVSWAKDPKKPKRKSAPSTFFVLMQTGDEVTLATSGPLELFATCTNLGGTVIRVNLSLASSEDGWLTSASPGVKSAVDLVSVCAVTEEDSTLSDCFKSGVVATAVSQNGNFLGFIREATGVGVNILGADCFVAGGILKAK